MPATEPRRSPEELARLGADVFDQQIRPALRPEDDGKFVAIDIRTGDYELDEDDYTAVARLRARSPAAEVWLERAGEPTAYQMRRDMTPLRLAFAATVLMAFATPRLAAQEIDGPALYEKCVKSCVFIYTPLKDDHREGSGTLIDAEQRLILTCSHVVDSSDTVYVQFPVRNKDGSLVTDKTKYIERVKAGQALKGKVLHRDKTRELALFQLEKVPPDTPALPMAAMTARVGESVIAIGNPRSRDSMFSSKEGVIRGVDVMDFHFTPVDMSRYKVLKVTHTAALSSDFWGGVLVDRSGRLVAIKEAGNSTDQPVHSATDVTEVWDFLVEKKLASGALMDPRPGLSSADKERVARPLLHRAKLFADSATYIAKLKDLVSKYPDTAAGKEAKKLLDEKK